MKFYLNVLLVGLIALPVFLKAQIKNQVHINATLQGQVLDQRTRTPISSATVRIKGISHSVITDDKGKFNIETAQTLPFTLVVSCIGYDTTEVIANGPSIEISLNEAQNILNDIVVVGYGTQKKSDITGSVVSISKSILQQPAPSFDNLLQGGAPGVSVTQSSAQPGSTATIRIRGGNSISFGNDPLYVIDGFIVYNNNNLTNTGATSGASVNALSTINPSDIESIEVLKDASATAIYGSRGANGVILITTKKGNKGRTEINYGIYVGEQSASKKLALLNGSEWASLVNDINISDNVPKTYTDAQIDSIGKGSDWQQAGIRNGVLQNHELSISGGDEKSKFSISGNYYDQQGIIINSGFKRYSARFNYDRDVTEKLKVSTSIFSSYTKELSLYGNAYNSLQPGNSWSTLVRTVPVVPIWSADGSWNTNNPYITTPTNPLEDIATTTNTSQVTRTMGNVSGEYKFGKELVFKISGGADIIHTKQNSYSPSTSSRGYAASGIASVGDLSAVTWMNENTLTYNHSFSNTHFLNVLLGYTTQYQQNEYAVANAQGFPNDLTTFNNLSSASTLLPANSGAQRSTMNSYLARINYSFLHKLNVTLSERADGSSVLGANNKWGFFPALGLSWNLSKERLLESISAIDNVKLRFSVGKTGNSNVPPYSSLASLGATNYYFGNPLKLVTGISPQQLANPDLKWETTTQYNAGLDLGLWHGRLNFIFDAYYKKTTDLLLQVPFPVYTGYASVLENVGSVENKGIEFSINSQNIKSTDFNWTSTLNFAANNNKVLSLGKGINSFYPTAPVGQNSPVIVQVGLPVGTFWGYSTDGLITAEDLQKGIPLLAGVSQQVGDRKYVAQNGHTTVTTADKHNLGSSQPKFTFGFTNTFQYKKFDLSFLWQGSYGNKLFNQLLQDLEKPTLALNSSANLANRWTPTHTDTDVPRATNSPVPQVIDRYVEDASYAKLKNLTLGYNFPNSFLNRLKIKDLRIYIAAKNLITITKYSGYDPEANYFDNDNTKQGIDYGIYPPTKTFLVGLNVSF